MDNRKHPYFRDALKSNDNSRSSLQSIFVEDPPTIRLNKDSGSLFFASNALITEIRMLLVQSLRSLYLFFRPNRGNEGNGVVMSREEQ